MVLLLSIVYIFLIFFAGVQWLFFPDYFGYFGYRRSTPRGKMFICFLSLLPLLVSIIMYSAWKVQSSVLSLVLPLAPLLLFFMLYLFKVNSQDRFFVDKNRMLRFAKTSILKAFHEFNTSSRKDSLTHYAITMFFPTLDLANVSVSLERHGVVATSKRHALTRFSSQGHYVTLAYDMPDSPDIDEVLDKMLGLLEREWKLGGEFAYFQAVTYDHYQAHILNASG